MGIRVEKSVLSVLSVFKNNKSIMTLEQLKALPHVEATEQDGMVTVTADEGYYLHIATTSPTMAMASADGTALSSISDTSSDKNASSDEQAQEEQTQHSFIKSISCPTTCEDLADYDIITSQEKRRLERGTTFQGMTLEEAKSVVTAEITSYDASSAVNSFSLNGASVWLDKATRVGLMNSTTIAKSMGSDTTTLWLGDVKLEVPCDKAIQLLSALEMYALDCFNVTAAHKKAVQELTTIEDVIAYDYTTNYPSKLEMTV